MDPLLLAAQLTLGVLGVLGVATASPENAFDHLWRMALAVALTFIVSRISPQRVVRFSASFFLGVLALLVLVLFVGVSPDGSEANRWLDLRFFTLQPSELMKVAVIAYLTAFFHNHLSSFQVWRPMFMVGLAVALIVAEPNISTAIFIFLLALAIMVAAGTTLWRLVRLNLLIAVFVAFFIAPLLNSQYPYLADRIGAHFGTLGSEEMEAVNYQADLATQVLQDAGIVGVGVGQPYYLPARDTDMIAISIGRALGLIGTATLFALYLLVALRGVQIASRVSGPCALLAIGATTYICGQAALNLLVAAKIIPVTGVPLPFVSYGFNSLLSVATAFGFLHAAHRVARAQQHSLSQPGETNSSSQQVGQQVRQQAGQQVRT